jgi:copper transport protein
VALLALLTVLVALVTGVAPASAHAVLEASTPAQGSRLTAPPAVVVLVFSEEVGVSSRAIQVLDARGRRVDLSDAAHSDGDPRALRVGLPPGLPTGSYTVLWRVVSVDGHPVSGTFAFGVGVDAGAPPAAVAVDSAVGAVRAVAQLSAYAGTAVVLGGSVFFFVLWPAGQRRDRLRRVLVTGCAVAGFGALATLLVQGPYVSGGGLGGMVDPRLLVETAGASYGRPLLLRVLAVGLSVPVLGIWPRVSDGEDAGPGAIAAAGNMLLLAASFALTGHAAEASPRLLAEAADAVHLTAAGVWLGGLVVLFAAFLPEADAGERAEVLPRWSRTAAACVGLLVLTGGYQAWREVRLLGALTGTAYGRLLLIKLAVVVIVLAVATLARLTLSKLVPTSAQASGRAAGLASGPASDVAAGATARLASLATVEALLGLVVLGVTSFLVATPPARVTFGPPYSANLQVQDVEGNTLDVVLDVASTRTGVQPMHLQVSTPEGVPASFRSAVVELRGPGDAPAPDVTFSPGPAPGEATARADLPTPGQWSLTVHVLGGPVTDYAAATTYTVR